MAAEDRATLFTNESFLIGVLQAVSGAALVAGLSQLQALIELAGRFALLLFLTAMVLALIAAVLAAFWKHFYKMWDVKAAVSKTASDIHESKGDMEAAAQEADEWLERHKSSNRDLRLMRGAMKASTVAVLAGFVILIGAMWIEAARSGGVRTKALPAGEEKKANPLKANPKANPKKP